MQRRSTAEGYAAEHLELLLEQAMRFWLHLLLLVQGSGSMLATGNHGQNSDVCLWDTASGSVRTRHVGASLLGLGAERRRWELEGGACCPASCTVSNCV